MEQEGIGEYIEFEDGAVYVDWYVEDEEVNIAYMTDHRGVRVPFSDPRRSRSRRIIRKRHLN
ncbi:hypothetical protein [Salinibacter phage M8CRM-1]|uniref:Uncharacterized protein n=1 Tax=Salinibacter phage M8CRM-1 TaxID=2681612 RepID=A0A2I6UGR6_9CAUD|nr:hypothetical protein FGG67_gp08 [Salinibacter phage M8CRM-1]AUO79179.1 hypothetical protein [Salinibacter phage M8CRM-1]